MGKIVKIIPRKGWTASDVGILMIIAPFVVAVVGALAALAIYETRAGITVIIMLLWFGTAIYLLKKDEDPGLW